MRNPKLYPCCTFSGARTEGHDFVNFFNGNRDLRRYGSSKQGPEMPSQFSRKASRRGVSYLFRFYVFFIYCLFLEATVLQRKRLERLPNFHKKRLDVVFLIFFIFTLFLSIVCFRRYPGIKNYQIRLQLPTQALKITFHDGHLFEYFLMGLMEIKGANGNEGG